MVILNWRIRRPRLLFASLSSSRLSIYTFRFRTTPPSLLSAPSFPLYPLSFQLSYGTARRRSSIRPTTELLRAAFHSRSPPRRFHQEKKRGKQEKERREIYADEEWRAGSRVEPQARERADSLTPYRRAPSRNALPHPDPHPDPHPRLWKKKLGYP